MHDFHFPSVFCCRCGVSWEVCPILVKRNKMSMVKRNEMEIDVSHSYKGIMAQTVHNFEA